jgi:hypothetical protein
VKKQVSPVVTVIVILVVVVIVALLWNHFTAGGGGSSSRGRGGMGLNIDMKKADMETARKNAAKAREGIIGQIKQSGTSEQGGE